MKQRLHIKAQLVLSIIAFLSCTSVVWGAKVSQNRSNLNNQATQPMPASHVAIPPRSQEVPIPADGDCLYKSIMVGYLLPVAHDAELFKVRLGMLVGDDKIMATEETKSDKGDENKDDSKININELWDSASLQSIFLALSQADLLYYLRQQYPFAMLARHMKQHIGIGDNVWGGPQEIQTIANQLRATIKEYTPDPKDNKKLAEPEAIVPEHQNSLLTLCIVRDNPTKEEAVNFLADKDMQYAQAVSAKEAQQRQHYRALLDVVPDFLQKKSAPSTNAAPSSPRKDKKKSASKGKPLGRFNKVKDRTGLEHMEAQRKAVSFANMIKQGLVKGDRGQVFKGLQLLKKIKIAHVSNPRLVMEKLLDALTCTEIEWEAYGIKRHIANTMRRFVYSMYLVGKQHKKYLSAEHKEELLKSIKQAVGLIKESKALGNGLRFELDVVHAMLKAMPDTTSKVDRWKDGVMTTIEGVKDKDPKKLLQALKNIYDQLKEKQSKNWYEVVLYIDYLKEQAAKNLATLRELQYLLYFYKQPRGVKTKALQLKLEDEPSKWKLVMKNSAAKIDPTNPGGYWHILYAGIEALSHVVQHAVGNKITRQKIVQQALESVDKQRPGLAYYFDFNKLSKLGVKLHNWRIREKAIESADTSQPNHPNKSTTVP